MRKCFKLCPLTIGVPVFILSSLTLRLGLTGYYVGGAFSRHPLVANSFLTINPPPIFHVGFYANWPATREIPGRYPVGLCPAVCGPMHAQRDGDPCDPPSRSWSSRGAELPLSVRSSRLWPTLRIRRPMSQRILITCSAFRLTYLRRCHEKSQDTLEHT